MNKKTITLLVCFLIAVAAGVAYPIFKIIRYEYPPVPPVTYRFATGIVDPYDPFRGRYVALNPLPTEVRLKEDKTFKYDTEIYAVLGKDKEGTATIVNLIDKPDMSGDCLRVKYYGYDKDRKNKIDTGYFIYSIRLPFNRYYLNERLAPEADKAVSEITRGKRDGKCIIIVRVYRDGNYAIDDLEINGKTVREYLKGIEEAKVK